MPITLNETDGGYVIGFEGNVDIACSTELKAALIQAISTRRELQLDLSLAGGLDITAIQLLWAAAREVEKAGMRLAMAGQAPENLSCAVREAGFEQLLGTTIPEDKRTDSMIQSAEKADARRQV